MNVNGVIDCESKTATKIILSEQLGKNTARIHSSNYVFCIHVLVSIFIRITHNHFWSAVSIVNYTYHIRTN